MKNSTFTHTRTILIKGKLIWGNFSSAVTVTSDRAWYFFSFIATVRTPYKNRFTKLTLRFKLWIGRSGTVAESLANRLIKNGNAPDNGGLFGRRKQIGERR